LPLIRFWRYVKNNPSLDILFSSFLKHFYNFPSILSLLFFLKGYPKTVQILLESGAHINWQNTAGETALIRVSFIRRVEKIITEGNVYNLHYAGYRVDTGSFSF